MRYWVGVASRDHVLLGVAGGFCQVCHGKQAPLARMKRGDWILYYSPKTGMNSGEKVQAFTAVGQIVDDRVYQFRMAENFEPFRRDVCFRMRRIRVRLRWHASTPNGGVMRSSCGTGIMRSRTISLSIFTAI